MTTAEVHISADRIIPDDWPNRPNSTIVSDTLHHWHIQITGRGPDLLLLHGLGGATVTWAGLVPLLATSHRVIALDLPGHGCTRPRSDADLTLGATTLAIERLMTAQGWSPRAVIGHAAGGALALDLALRRPDLVPGIACINAALDTDAGAGWLSPIRAKALSLNPLSARLIAASATEETVRRFLMGTGSTVRPEMVKRYAALMQMRAHVDGALRMMAEWDSADLPGALPRIAGPALFIAASDDAAIDAGVSIEAAASIPDGESLILKGLGHLAHEEAPERIADPLLFWLDRQLPL